VARRLSSLPALREALLAGQVGWSMAELVSRHATAETDGELTEQAQQRTVRQMRAWLSESHSSDGASEPEPGGAVQAQPPEARGAAATSPEPHPLFMPGGDGEPITVTLEAAASLAELDEADPVRTLTLTLEREVAWLLEATRILVEHLGGQRDTESWLEAVLAEALTSLPGKRRGEFGDGVEAELERAWLEQRARWRDQSEARCEQNFTELLRLGAQPAGAAQLAESLGDPGGLESIAELDRWIASAAGRLATADLRLASLAERMHELEGWRRLGFASENQYARERLGLSASSLRAKRALVRQLRPLRHVRRALGQGPIGFDAAGQLAQVATGQTEQQWVERARRRTAKHLREEIELAELAARRTGQHASLPPTEEQMRVYFELQRAVTSGRALVAAAVAQQRRAGADAAPEPAQGAAQDQASTAQRQMSAAQPAAAGGHPALRGGGLGSLQGLAATVRAHLGLGRDGSGPASALDELCRGLVDRRICWDKTAGSGQVTWRLRVRESLIRLWRSVEREAARSIPRDMSFVEYACLTFWSSWWHVLDRTLAYADIYARDRHRCSCPVCSRRDVTPHHVQYRSRGGDDSAQNVAAICSSCHLELIHGGAIQVEGPASRLHWSIGRSRGLVVEGRKLVLGSAAQAAPCGSI
jgi:hypothetical protein